MSRIVIDATDWNYVAKAHVLPQFLKSLPFAPVLLPSVEWQIRKAVASWPELSSVLDAVEDGHIETTDLTDAEQISLDLLNQRPGFGVVDCALLAVCLERGWTLLTSDKNLRNWAEQLGVALADLSLLLEDAVGRGLLDQNDREWIVYYAQGGTKQRNE